ncbi:MAG: VanZ family protein [Bacteroidetes bacterium]|nr:VanZ family protein [Bacteroidota bacterium]MBS1630455.1 VanZ family protein [Bacteroidota bacterium]
MLHNLFVTASPYRKLFLWLALIWTLGIFIACLWPGNELPKTDVPFMDKWTHLVLFGVFAFVWLCAFPGRKPGFLLLVFLISVALGWLVECLQGWLPQLGRSKDVEDALANAIGGALGALLFRLGQWRCARHSTSG